jgi:hypothetical protein
MQYTPWSNYKKLRKGWLGSLWGTMETTLNNILLFDLDHIHFAGECIILYYCVAQVKTSFHQIVWTILYWCIGQFFMIPRHQWGLHLQMTRKEPLQLHNITPLHVRVMLQLIKECTHPTSQDLLCMQFRERTSSLRDLTSLSASSTWKPATANLVLHANFTIQERG